MWSRTQSPRELALAGLFFPQEKAAMRALDTSRWCRRGPLRLRQGTRRLPLLSYLRYKALSCEINPPELGI